MARWVVATQRRNGTSSDDDFTLRLRCRVSEIARLETALAEETVRFEDDCKAGERNDQAAIVADARRQLAMRAAARLVRQG